VSARANAWFIGPVYDSLCLNDQFPFLGPSKRPFHLPAAEGAGYPKRMFELIRNVRVPLRRLLFWAAMFLALVMAVLPHPPEIPGEPSDKVQHMIAFATLGVLGTWAYVAAPLLQLLGGLSLFGALIEVVQAIPALHRDSDVKDWIADTLACGMVLLIVRWRRSRSRRAEQSR
jgi:hypothetical protein